MGFEDEKTTDEIIEEANNLAESKRKEAEQRHAATLAQHEKNKQDYELVRQLAEVMGYKQQQEDIDHLKQGFEALQNSTQVMLQALQGLKTEIEKTNQVVNQQSQIIMGQQQTAAGVPATQNEARLLQLGDLARQIAEVYKLIKGEPQVQVGIPGLDANSLMAEAVEAVRDDFSIGKELRGAIKQSIRKKVVSNVIQNVLTDDSHGPA